MLRSDAAWGRTYALWDRAALATGHWSLVAVQSNASGPLTWTGTVSEAGMRFYRLTVEGP